jgi:hypothetical protein
VKPLFTILPSELYTFRVWGGRLPCVHFIVFENYQLDIIRCVPPPLLQVTKSFKVGVV